MPRRLLVLMAKEPAAGESKIQLEPILDLEGAAELHRCFLIDKMARMDRVRMATPAIAYHPPEARTYFQELAPQFAMISQQGETLNERLRYVFEFAFEQGYHQVAAIDTDSVSLPLQNLKEIFTRLDDPEVDLVLGPSEDGGYYAVGMKKPIEQLFEVNFDSDKLFESTLEIAKEADLNVVLTSEWYDVETPDDLERLSKDLAENDPDGELATTHFLREFGMIPV